MTTIVSVRRNGHVVIAGDGQATLGNTVMKGNVKKVRRLYNDKVIAGFAGGTADALRCSNCLNVNWKCIRAIWLKPPLSWQKTGVPIACCANLKHCWQSRMKLHRLSSPVTVTWCSQKTILLLSAPQPLRPGCGACTVRKILNLVLVKLLKRRSICRRHCIYTNHFHTIEELSYKA
ncbi:HslU--HslV peptidase proteolytic subunit [Escherichia coli]